MKLLFEYVLCYSTAFFTGVGVGIWTTYWILNRTSTKRTQ
jgi:hypothetical protein